MIKTSQKYKSLLPGAALALLIVVGSPSIATARPGSDDRETVTTAVTDDSQMATSGAPVAETETETGQREELRSRGEAKVKALRAERKTDTTPQKREKICDGRKNGLETKFASITRNAERYQDRVDGVFNKLPATAMTSAPAEYDAALKAQAKAIISVRALGDIKASTLIDCKNLNVANEVATFKTAAATARTDLKAYKMSVKDVLKALKTTTVKPAETTKETN